MYMYEYTHKCLHICIHVYIYTYTYIHVYIYIYTHIFINHISSLYTSTRTHSHTHIHICGLQRRVHRPQQRPGPHRNDDWPARQHAVLGLLLTSRPLAAMCYVCSNPMRSCVCCSVLQCVAVCCSVLQCVADLCSAVQCSSLAPASTIGGDVLETHAVVCVLQCVAALDS